MRRFLRDEARRKRREDESPLSGANEALFLRNARRETECLYR